MGKFAIGEGRSYVDQNAKAAERTARGLLHTLNDSKQEDKLERRSDSVAKLPNFSLTDGKAAARKNKWLDQ